MECQSYFPVYHSNYDLNSDANGSSKPIHYGNSTFQSGHYSKYMLPKPLPAPQGPLEFVRQTILMHEATFRDQVRELHRLYRRQKEVMGEIRSQQLYMNHFHLEDHQSSNSFANYSYGVQNTLYSLPFVSSHLGNGNIEALPRNSFKDHRISSISIMSQSDGNSNNLHIPESKIRKIGGKFLDLELPAEVYIDSEEGESLEDAKFLEPHIMLSSGKPFNGSFSSSSSFPKFNTNLTDLNEAIMVSSPGKNCSVVQALPCFVNQISSTKGAKIVSVIRRHIDHKLDASSTLKNSGFQSTISLPSVTSDHLLHMKGLNNIDLNTELTSSSDTTKAETTRTQLKSKKCRLIDINLPYDPASEEESVIEDHVVEDDYKNSAQKSSCSEKNELELELKAPPSPEVEERPPPRGDSEENLLETRQVSGGDPFEELAKSAAEAIVSLSSLPSSKTPPFPDLQKSDTPVSGTLEWFAGLIHSISKENDIPEKLDEFEAMTLELTEMKEEEYWSKSGSSSAKLTCSIPHVVGTPMRKGRTRRSKRKDFQKEVLPSLASLSRFEVTEDMQLIEGLMEAAGTPCRMRRKHRAAKKPTSELPEFHGGPLMSSGWAKRRPRGKRNRASPSMVLTRWLEFSDIDTPTVCKF